MALIALGMLLLTVLLVAALVAMWAAEWRPRGRDVEFGDARAFHAQRARLNLRDDSFRPILEGDDSFRALVAGAQGAEAPGALCLVCGTPKAVGVHDH